MQPQFYRLADLTGQRRGKAKQPGLLPVSPAQVWRWVKAGTFPAPVKLGPNLTAWRAADVRAWADARSADPLGAEG